MLNRLPLIVTTVSLLSAAACDWNQVEHGRYDVLTFTPDDCGREGCDLDDEIAVGGALTVQIEAVDGDDDVFGLTLISSDPYVIDVYPIYEGSFWSEYEVIAYGAGWADLIAIDGAGYEVDYVTVYVAHPDTLFLHDRVGNAGWADRSRPEADETWTVRAGELVSLEARPAYDGFEMMGRMTFDVEIDESLLVTLDPASRLTEGRLDFRPTAGTHDVRFVSTMDGTTLDARFIAQ
jgi:hypothetical protein